MLELQEFRDPVLRQEMREKYCKFQQDSFNKYVDDYVRLSEKQKALLEMI